MLGMVRLYAMDRPLLTVRWLQQAARWCKIRRKFDSLCILDAGSERGEIAAERDPISAANCRGKERRSEVPAQRHSQDCCHRRCYSPSTASRSSTVRKVEVSNSAWKRAASRYGIEQNDVLFTNINGCGYFGWPKRPSFRHLDNISHRNELLILQGCNHFSAVARSVGNHNFVSSAASSCITNKFYKSANLSVFRTTDNVVDISDQQLACEFIASYLRQGAPMTIVDTIVVSTTILTLSTSTQSVSGPTSTHSSTASTDGNAQQSVTGPATIAGITVLSVIGMVILCQLVSTVVRCRRNRHWRLEQRLDEGTWRRSIPESNRHSSQPRQRMLALATTLPGRPVSLGDAVEPLTASDRSRRTGTTSSLSKSSFVSFMEPAVTQQSRASLLLHVFGPPAGGDEQPLLQQHPNLSIQQQQQQRQPQQYNHLQPHSAVTVAWTAERGLALSRLSATPTPVAVLVDSGGGSYAANSEMSHSYSSRDDVYSLSPPLPPQQQVCYRVSCDLAFVDAVYDRCSAATASADIHPYLDHHCLVPGRPWEDGFLRGLDSAPLVFLVISRASAASLRSDSDNVVLEWEYALNRLNAGSCVAVVPLFVDYRDPSSTTTPYSPADFAGLATSFPEIFHNHPRSPKTVTIRKLMESIASMHSITVTAKTATKRAEGSSTDFVNVVDVDVRGFAQILGAVARTRNRGTAGSTPSQIGAPVELFLSQKEENELRNILLKDLPNARQSTAELMLERCPLSLSSELNQWMDDPTSQVLAVKDVKSEGFPYLKVWLESALLQEDLLIGVIDISAGQSSVNSAVRQIIFHAALYAPELGRKLLVRASSFSEQDLAGLLSESLAACVNASGPNKTVPAAAVLTILFDDSAESQSGLASVLGRLEPALRTIPELKILIVHSLDERGSSAEVSALRALLNDGENVEVHHSRIAVSELLVQEVLTAASNPAFSAPKSRSDKPAAQSTTPSPEIKKPVMAVSPAVPTTTIESGKPLPTPDFIICFGAQIDTSVVEALRQAFISYTRGDHSVAIQPLDRGQLNITINEDHSKGKKPVYLFLVSNSALRAMCNGERVFLEQISQGLAASSAGTILAMPVLVNKTNDPFSFKLVGEVREAVVDDNQREGVLDALLKLQGERLNPQRIANFIPRVFQIRKIALDLAFTGIATSHGGLLSSEEIESLRAWLTPADEEVLAERGRLLEQYVPGTRGQLLGEIESFLAGKNGTDRRVMWLKGQAGVGKSVISALIANTLQHRNNLGAVFFCKHGDAQLSSAYTLIRTLSFSLCLWSPVFGRLLLAIKDAADDDPKRVFRCSASLLFSRLLSDPLQEVLSAQSSNKNTSPKVVLLVDALDECGSADARTDVLAVFSKGFEELPLQVKIIVTSRPEGDIVAAMSSASPLERNIVPSDAEGRADAAIVAARGVREIFRRQSVQRTSSLTSTDSPLSAHQVSDDDESASEVEAAAVAAALVEKSGGLLVWLAVALKMLDEFGNHSAFGSTSRVDASALTAAVANLPIGLASLHESVFRRAFGHRSSPRLSLVVGLLAVSREALTAAQIADVSAMRPRQAEYCLLQLRAVLTDVESAAAFNHKSVTDYLTGDDCTDPRFRVYQAKLHRRMAAHLLDLLNARLVVGISKAPASREYDGQPNHRIDPSLSYACRMWAWHLSAGMNVAAASGQTETSLLLRLHAFSTNHLLHWIEAMAALQHYDQVGTALTHAQSFLAHLSEDANRTADSHDKLSVVSELLSDALRVVLRFRTPIIIDPMQVYYTAVPQSPVETLLFRTFAQITFGRQNQDPSSSSASQLSIAPLFPLLPTSRLWDAFRCAEDVGQLTSHVEFATVPSPSTDSTSSVNAAVRRTLLAVFSTDSAKVLEVMPGGSLREVLLAPLSSATLGSTRAFALSRHGARMAMFAHNDYNATALRVWEPSAAAPRLLYALIGPETDGSFVKRVGVVGKAINSVKKGWKKLWRAKPTTEDERLGPPNVREKVITVLRFTSDEGVLLGGTSDGCLIAWSVRDPSEPQYLGCQQIHKGLVADIVVGRTDSEIFTAFADGSVKIFTGTLTEASGGRPFAELQGEQAVQGVAHLSLSFDGRRLLTSGGGRAALWAVHAANKTISLQLVKDIHATDEGDLLARFSPRATYIAVRHRNGVQLWDADANTRVGEINQSRQYGYGGAVEFAFTDDEDAVATGADVKTVTVWSVKDAVAAFAHSDVTADATSAQTTTVLEVKCDDASKTQLAEGVDVIPLILTSTLVGKTSDTRSSSTVYGVDFSEGGRCIMATDGARLSRLWDLDDGGRLVLRSTVGTGNVWRPNPSVFVARNLIWTHPLGSGSDATVSSHAFRFSDERFDRWTRVAVSQDGSIFVYLSESNIGVVSIPLKKVVTQFETAEDDVIALSPDGTTLALANSKGVVHIWDLLTGRVAGTFSIGPTKSALLQKSMEVLAKESMDRAWNENLPELNMSFLPDEPRAIAFAPLLLTTGLRRLVFSFCGVNVLLETLAAPPSATVPDRPPHRMLTFNDPLVTGSDFSTALAFSADGNTLVNICFGVAKIWAFDTDTAPFFSSSSPAPPPRLAATIDLGRSFSREIAFVAPDASCFALRDGSVWDTAGGADLADADDEGGPPGSERRLSLAPRCLFRLEGEWARFRGRPPMWLPQGLRGCCAFEPKTGRLALGGTELVGVWQL
ncbi:hypothetical protein DFJ73DRAFT_961245 [Zopfochytrium polystomum]|nr:hypothetical protein DFJ73DRAFT_961245 [Zopfochytrium polystomum]